LRRELKQRFPTWSEGELVIRSVNRHKIDEALMSAEMIETHFKQPFYIGSDEEAFLSASQSSLAEVRLSTDLSLDSICVWGPNLDDSFVFQSELDIQA
jgi:hypothetical protein